MILPFSIDFVCSQDFKAVDKFESLGVLKFQSNRSCRCMLCIKLCVWGGEGSGGILPKENFINLTVRECFFFSI